MTTTQALINEYNERIVARFDRAPMGSTRAVSRQSRIDSIVEELEARADSGDVEAEEWFTK